MQANQGNNLPRVKVTNQAAIRRMIYFYGPIMRGEIAERLGLTLPTITTNVNSMISHGIVSELRGTETAVKTIGRKANPVDISPDSRYFIGAEMRGSRRFVITNYRGKIVHSVQDWSRCQTYEENISLTCRYLNELLHSGIVPEEKIAGLGFCLPGIVDSAQGTLRAHRQYQWFEKDIAGDIRSHTGYRGPITVENDACARAYSVQLFQRELLTSSPSFLYLYVADGVSCPLILNPPGHLSYPLGPGELGYMIMDSTMPANQWGSTGSLSSFSGERSITEQCAAAIERGEAPVLKELCHGETPAMAQILKAQEFGEESIEKIISTAVFYLGIAMANIDNFARPATMLIDARALSREKNRDHFLDTFYKNTFRPVSTAPNFVFIEHSDLNGAKGAAAAAIRTDLESYIE